MDQEDKLEEVRKDIVELLEKEPSEVEVSAVYAAVKSVTRQALEKGSVSREELQKLDRLMGLLAYYALVRFGVAL